MADFYSDNFDGYVIVIPSKIEGADLKSMCKKAHVAVESCHLWPVPHIKTGLTDHHLPYLMWNIVIQIRNGGGEGIVNVFTDVSASLYDFMSSLHAHLNTEQGGVYKQLMTMCDALNCKLNVEIVKIVKMSSEMFYLLLSLPKHMLSKNDIWSAVRVYKWTPLTVAALSLPQQSIEPSQEKKILLNWLLPQLHNKSCELTAYPKEDSLRLVKPPKNFSVAREIEFRLETISQSLANTVVKVMVIRKVNRAVVQFKPYLLKLLEDFLQKNQDFECFCIIELMASDGVRTLGDVCGDLNMQVYTAFQPQQYPVTCLMLHATSNKSDAEPQDLSQENLEKINKELEVISEELKEEKRILHEQETSLKERERMLYISQENLQTVADLEKKQRVTIVEELQLEALKSQHKKLGKHSQSFQARLTKLQEENRILHEQEKNLKERERMLSISQENQQTVTDIENYKSELKKLETALIEKTRENKRLKDNFETLKMANDAQKKELEVLKSEHEKLEKQSLQTRVTKLKPGRKRKISDSATGRETTKRKKVHHQCYSAVPGKVLVCGEGDVGQLGLGEDVMERGRPALVEIPAPVVQVCGGGIHTVCLTDSGDVYSFGYNDEGALGRDTSEEGSETHPGKVDGLPRIVMVSAGESHTAALSEEGQVYLWGSFSDSNGPMGTTVDGIQNRPIKVMSDQVVIKIASGGDHLVSLTEDGKIYTCGCAEQGQLGRVAECFAQRGGRKDQVSIYLEPKQVRFSRKNQMFEDCFAGQCVTFAREKKSGKIYAWGLNNYYQLGFSDLKNRFVPEMVKSFGKKMVSVRSGLHHTIALDNEGLVYAVGRAEYGRLGLGENCVEVKEPTLVKLESKCVAISASNAVSFALLDDGTVSCWGIGSCMQLGSGSKEDSFCPTKMAGDRKVLQVSSGGQHTVLLAVDNKDINTSGGQ